MNINQPEAKKGGFLLSANGENTMLSMISTKLEKC